MSSYIKNQVQLGISTAAITKNRFIKAGDGKQRVTQAVENDVPIGIARDTVTEANKEVNWSNTGGELLTLKETVLAGAPLKPDATGLGLNATVGTDHVAAIALQAGDANDVIEVLIK